MNSIYGLYAAIITASIALIGKMAFDFFDRYRERRAIASALAGELQAIIDLSNTRQLVPLLEGLNLAAPIERCRLLQSLPPPLSEATVFKSIANRIGILSTDLAFDISRTYSVVSGMRQMFGHLSSENFSKDEFEGQTAQIGRLLEILQRDLPVAHKLIADLQDVARQHWLSYLFGCGPK